MKKIFIAKPNTWYKEGTECKLLQEYEENGFGLFEGIRIAQEDYEKPRHEIGEEYLDEEVCTYDEFYIVEIADYKGDM
jgi:hypothetical protein